MINSCLLASRTAESRLITIEVEQANGVATIKIEDKGELIETGDSESELSPFGIDSDEQIYGIGLAVSRKIIQGHHGELTLENLSVVGNRFLMTLPLK